MNEQATKLMETDRDWHLNARKGGKLVRLTGTYRRCRHCKGKHPALFLGCPEKPKEVEKVHAEVSQEVLRELAGVG